MKYILIILIFLSGCTIKKEQKIDPWKSTIIQYGMISCMKSLEQVYDKKNVDDANWNGSKAALHCGCTMDHLRKKVTQEYFISKLRENKLGNDLKKASDYCKNINGNWYEEK